MNPKSIFEIQSGLCRAMVSPLRMEIMHLLRNGPLNVGDLASAASTPPTTVSRNLAILRNAGAVITRRDGNTILYNVANPKLMSVCDLMRQVLIEQIDEQTKLIESDEE